MEMYVVLYLSVVVVALIIVLIYAAVTKRDEGDNIPKTTVSNSGDAIVGGKDFFSLVNR